MFAKPRISPSIRAGFPGNCLLLSQIAGSASLESCLSRRRQSLNRHCVKVEDKYRDPTARPPSSVCPIHSGVEDQVAEDRQEPLQSYKSLLWLIAIHWDRAQRLCDGRSHPEHDRPRRSSAQLYKRIGDAVPRRALSVSVRFRLRLRGRVRREPTSGSRQSL